ncbi:MAG: glutamate formiminotransferase [Acidimicrobiales bacterium]
MGAPAECVINISEGRDAGVIATVTEAGGDLVVDVHSDPEHNRTVLTLLGTLADVEEAARTVTAAAIPAIDLRVHRGVHPRLGAVDVVPFVPLVGPGGAVTPWESVLHAQDAFASWAGATLGVPCFLYGPERSLPDIRRGAFTVLSPDTGPPSPHPTAGATAVGARTVLIAYNVWIGGAEQGARSDHVAAVARLLASMLRRPGLRTLGLAVDGGAQVSCNLVDPDAITLTEVFDDVARGAAENGCTAIRGELVGLLPASALAAVPKHRWPELGLRAECAIDFRLGLR